MYFLRARAQSAFVWAFEFISECLACAREFEDRRAVAEICVCASSGYFWMARVALYAGIRFFRLGGLPDLTKAAGIEGRVFGFRVTDIGAGILLWLLGMSARRALMAVNNYEMYLGVFFGRIYEKRSRH